MRHRIANVLYAIASRIDRPARSGYGDTSFGDKQGWEDLGNTTINVGVHMRNDTPVRGDFQPGSFTYAALHFGRGVEMTVFLTRTSGRKLMAVLGQIERGFIEHGEGQR